VAQDIEHFEAGGFEDDLRRLIDEVETRREEQLRQARGRVARAGIVGEIRAEVLALFEQLHPGVKVRFLSGPYRDPNVRSGPARRMR
jgi:hypothetical protein